MLAMNISHCEWYLDNLIINPNDKEQPISWFTMIDNCCYLWFVYILYYLGDTWTDHIPEDTA